MGEAVWQVGRQLRTFFTDASGMVINKEVVVMETGWAVVETKLGKESELVKVKQWGQKERGMPSVQKCEALAVEEVVKGLERGEMANIYTDSKVTVQSLRTIMSGVIGISGS